MKAKTLFIALSAFSQTGGIQKFNRALMYALQKISDKGRVDFRASVFIDSKSDPRYVESKKFFGYDGNKVVFAINQLFVAARYDLVILGHLNLAPIGVLIKTVFPRKKIILICHGAEVFAPVDGARKKLLQLADCVLAVSNYTKDKLVSEQGIDANKISVFPNTLDPFFEFPKNFAKPKYLLDRYGIKPEEKIILTLTRQSSAEKYKGYDQILSVLLDISKQGQKVKYLLAGGGDSAEVGRIKSLIDNFSLQDLVILPGEITEKELSDHYLLSDVFVMPSKGEGFGIVFIEAMACGLPVIAGSKDGSRDALKNGEFGTLVDPDNLSEIESALLSALKSKPDPEEIQRKVVAEFGFDKFQDRLSKAINGYC